MITVVQKVFGGLWALCVGLSVTLRNAFRKPVTIQYGYAPRWGKTETRPIAPRYRGRFVLVRDPDSGELRCTGCGLCARACPGRCIEVSGENRKVTAYRIEAEKCLMCGLCVEACPFEALGMMQETLPFERHRFRYHLDLDDLAQPAGAPMPGVMPSTVGPDLRPGKQPYGQKKQAAAESPR